MEQHTVQRLGKLSILVSKAGGAGPKPFDMPMADFRQAFGLNVFSLFRLTKLAVPKCKKQVAAACKSWTGGVLPTL